MSADLALTEKLVARQKKEARRKLDTLLRENIHIPAKDEKGHYRRYTVEVPDTMLAQIDDLLQQDGIPFRNTADFIRYAIHHTTQWVLDELQHESPACLKGLRKWEMFDATVPELVAAETERRFEELLPRFVETAADYIEGGSRERALALLRRIRKSIAQMDHSPSASRMTGKLRYEFPKLMAELDAEPETPATETLPANPANTGNVLDFNAAKNRKSKVVFFGLDDFDDELE